MLPESAPVLLVDDDADDRFLIRQAWLQASINNPLVTVEDGAKALALVLGDGEFADRARHPLPGLLLLDIKMPGLMGFDVLERIRGDRGLHRLPVLMLTASTAPDDVDRSFELGANAFFIKPSTFQELIELFKAFKVCWLRFGEFPSPRAPLDRPLG